MVNFSRIVAFNNELIKSNTKIKLHKYFLNLHKEHFNHIDISFMNYILSIIPKYDEYCIIHEKLLEYNAITNDRHLDRCFSRFEENKGDYITLNYNQLIELKNSDDYDENGYIYLDNNKIHKDTINQYEDSLKHTIIEENKINTQIIKTIQKFMDKKVYEDRNFQMATLAFELGKLLKE